MLLFVLAGVLLVGLSQVVSMWFLNFGSATELQDENQWCKAFLFWLIVCHVCVGLFSFIISLNALKNKSAAMSVAL